jgi:hypothetical protein
MQKKYFLPAYWNLQNNTVATCVGVGESLLSLKRRPPQQAVQVKNKETLFSDRMQMGVS